MSIIIEGLRINRYATLNNIVIDPFPKRGLIMVEGIKDDGGSNGVGKSALLESILFALTGKTIRGTVPHNPSVDLRYTFEGRTYSIVRDGSSLDLYIDGKKVIDSKAKLQEMINSTLKVSYKTVQFLTYFTPDTITKWFTSYTDTDRKELFTDILDLSFLDRILEDVKKIANNIELEMTRLEYALKEKLNTIEDLKARVSPLLKEKEIFDKELEELKLKYELEINNTEDLKKILTKIDKIKEQNKSSMYSIEYELRNLERQKSELLKKVSSVEKLVVCPTCFQPVPDEYKEKVRNEISIQVEDLEKQISNLESKLSESKQYVDYISSFYKEVYDLFTKSSSLASLDANIETIQQLESQVPGIRERLNALFDELSKAKALVEIFSPKGIKAGVISKIIGDIGKHMEIYSSLVGLPSSVDIDNKGKLDYSLDYRALSSGQKRRLEVAFLFALRTVLPSPINLIVIDEVFDHLDQIGIECVNDIVQSIWKHVEVPIFVISHRSDFPLRYSEKWVLKMENGSVRRIEIITEDYNEEVIVN